MIRALVTGTLHEPPVARVSKNGKNFTTAKLRVDGAEDNVSCSLIAFETLADALAKQRPYAALQVGGRATLSVRINEAGEPQANLVIKLDRLTDLRPPESKPAPAPAKADPHPAPLPACTHPRWETLRSGPYRSVWRCLTCGKVEEGTWD